MWRIILPMAALALAVAGAGAQEKKSGTESRTVTGTVVDTKNKPVASAIVYCKNLRTHTTRMKYADKNGHFDLAWLEPGVDYEIHAEHGHHTSAKHLVFQSDSHKVVDIVLKLDRAGTASP
jgi:hypothetical protein